MRRHNGQAKPNRIQGPVQLEHIEAIEKRLWTAADTLRSNSNYASNEYFMPVMGLIFLRHAYSRYLGVKDDIEAKLAQARRKDACPDQGGFLPEKRHLPAARGPVRLPWSA